MEKVKQKVFVKVNSVWQKAEVTGEIDDKLSISTKDGQVFNVPKDSQYVEEIQRPSQQYAYKDVKEKLEGNYISFEKLPESVRDQLTDGREYLHEGSYVSEGELKSSTKMVQMAYDPTNGSQLNVQWKRHEHPSLEEAKAYNYQFSAKEYDQMTKQNKAVLFQGNTQDGEMFQKLAYYEPRLNAIRTKPALNTGTYFYGERLTQEKADKLNKGEEVMMKITNKQKKESKDYLVSYSPKTESFITKKIEQKKAEKIEVNETQKKKSRSRGIGV